MARSKLFLSIFVVVFCIFFTVVSLAEVDVTDESSESAVALTDRAIDIDPLTTLTLHRPVNDRHIPLKHVDVIPSGEDPAVSASEFNNPQFLHHHLHLHHHHHHFYDHHHRHHEDTDSDDDEDEEHSLKEKKNKKAAFERGYDHGEISGEKRMMASVKKTKKHCHGFMKRVIKFFERYF